MNFQLFCLRPRGLFQLSSVSSFQLCCFSTLSISRLIIERGVKSARISKYGKEDMRSFLLHHLSALPSLPSSILFDACHSGRATIHGFVIQAPSESFLERRSFLHSRFHPHFFLGWSLALLTFTFTTCSHRRSTCAPFLDAIW